MSETLPIIHEFIISYKRHWIKNTETVIDGRLDSSLYFPIRGKLIFKGDFGTIVCDPAHPLYIPHGIYYRYKSEVETDAYLFNFNDTTVYKSPTPVLPVNINEVENAYKEISLLKIIPSAKSYAKIFSILYNLMSLSLPDTRTSQQSAIMPALEHIMLNYNNPSLSIDVLAQKCHISKIYLHKLFVKTLGVTPYRYITKTRMERASVLLKEGKPVTHVSTEVGYSDIYTFSRAYKNYFGTAPKTSKPK